VAHTADRLTDASAITGYVYNQVLQTRKDSFDFSTDHCSGPARAVGPACVCVCVCVLAAVRDYCQWDTFDASCRGRDELVVMKSAIYGRMSSGRCIERDYGYVGCHSDVLLNADLRCSGRRNCKLDIPYQPFGVGHPCPRDLTLFLRASFDCVKG